METSASPPPALRDLVDALVEHLVEGDYAWVERRTGGVRLSAADLQRVVEEYPGALGPIGPSWPECRSVFTVWTADVPTYAVDVELWDAEGRRSELTLQLTVVDPGGPCERLEVDDLHVL